MTSATAAEEALRQYAPYDPAKVEQRWYTFWRERGYFKPETARDPSKPPFVITMPPPNVTGELHMGHAVRKTVEDTLVRWHRMLGEPTLWVPGRDHAGIAAQLVVERLLAQEGKTRHDLGREAFLQRMWDWMDRYGKVIQSQLYRLGASADWDRERFTMDPGPARAVRTAFVRLYEQGLIYRGNRITSWCPRCATALSDLEVVHEEVQGQLAYVRYPIVGEPGRFVTVATTRPETILADTGVAVHPDDPRYRDLVGKQALVPVVDRPVPIVADPAVDPEFGTGAVKVTPGHDPVDFEIGQRHGLPTLIGIGLDLVMTDVAGPYAGQPAREVRQRLLADLAARGLLVKTEPHAHQVGHCQRCHTVVEPIVTEQWYVRIKPLAEPAIAAVREGRIRIIPERFEKVYFNWMENIRDWCISRQLWWGHRIPVWYCDACGGQTVAVTDPTACQRCGSAQLRQDPDVLDTWFSSGLWPFSTLGWPDDTEDLRRYYPTTVMETAYDILFFWVARMIMLGLELTGKVPFRTVLLGGLIRVPDPLSGRREKMSKTKGNVVDPLEVIDRYGADALRIALLVGSAPGNDLTLPPGKIEAGRDFVNKLWNAGRFVLANTGPEARARASEPLAAPAGATLADRWIVSRTHATVREVHRLLEEFQLGEAARTAQDFFWGDFADWYVEIAKVQLRQARAAGDAAARLRTELVLAQTFEKLLRLFHPFIPFITEELWQALVARPAADAGRPDSDRPDALIIAPWPEPGATDAEAEERLAAFMELVRGIRRLRADYRIEPGRPVAALVAGGADAAWLETLRAPLAALARLEPLTIAADLGAPPARALGLVAGPFHAYLPIAGLFDPARELERASAEAAAARADVARLEALLARPGFAERAPAEVVERERERLAEARAKLERLNERLAFLRGLA